MPWIKTKAGNENVKLIEGTNEEIKSQFEEFLEGQRQRGHTVTESENFEGEWEIKDGKGNFIDIYYIDW